MSALGFSSASHFHRWKAVKWSCHYVAVLIVSDRAGYLHAGGTPRRSYHTPAAATNRDGWQCTNTAYLHSYLDVYCVTQYTATYRVLPYQIVLFLLSKRPRYQLYKLAQLHILARDKRIAFRKCFFKIKYILFCTGFRKVVL